MPMSRLQFAELPEEVRDLLNLLFTYVFKAETEDERRQALRALRRGCVEAFGSQYVALQKLGDGRTSKLYYLERQTTEELAQTDRERWARLMDSPTNEEEDVNES